MKVIFLLLAALYIYSANAQTKNDTVPKMSIKIDRLKEKRDKINAYADSINHYNGGVLPCFLLEACFDYKNYLWDGPHDRISPRWKILQKVNNKIALGKIIANNDKRMDEKCSSVKPYDIRTDIPFMKESFLALLKIRYKEL
ncbi:hypothetical protein [Chitinophaga sp.]|uniref:hypothetical protein n=1 Tax=Chitinophaga sp. TaxID=1869181 RepID=UPI0031E05EE5